MSSEQVEQRDSEVNNMREGRQGCQETWSHGMVDATQLLAS